MVLNFLIDLDWISMAGISIVQVRILVNLKRLVVTVSVMTHRSVREVIMGWYFNGVDRVALCLMCDRRVAMVVSYGVVVRIAGRFFDNDIM